MRKKLILVCMLIAISMQVPAQVPTAYTAENNVHSHNDYCQNVPFYTAYSARCASIEADIYLVNGELYVAHERDEITPVRTLRTLYLEPIRQQMKINGGKV